MMRYVRMMMACLVLVVLVSSVQEATAQLGRLKQRAKDRIERKVGEKQDEVIDQVFEGSSSAETEQAEDVSEAPAAGATPAASTAAETSPSAENSAASTAAPAAPAAQLKPGEGAWANYDFVPGERPIFVDDFSTDRIGNFPQRMEFRSGNMQIVEWEEGRWLSAERGEFFINLPEVLPDRFTMEFNLAGNGNAMEIAFGPQDGQESYPIQIGEYSAQFRAGDLDAQGDLKARTGEGPVRIRISVDGGYLKLYANEHRALNVPNATMLGRSNRIYVNMNGWSADQPRMMGDVEIMAGSTPMYEALVAEGRFATQGIFFDSGSDVIRPESTPTLREIGETLRQHADLRLRIEGHTDDVGDEAANLALSEKRAAAVRAFLTEAYGVDASRLESQGLGESAPMAGNDTPEGRQENRRVELVRL